MVLLGMLGAAWTPIHRVWCCTCPIGQREFAGISGCPAERPALRALTMKTGSTHDLRHPDRRRSSSVSQCAAAGVEHRSGA
ncbi:hypothetical protein PviCFBP13515_08180 [Pseudomonas viridiflava]|nr:hypothetical protein PviCFBP13507_05235 [Pseudomonas viridiflava]TKK29867.1 hypothetical protein PviCFBP13515_08180 [Pseudomonas viridiflava]